MLPNNFNLYICGKDELDKYSNRSINYALAFTHLGNKFAPEIDKLNHIDDYAIYSYHDAYTEEHKVAGLKMPDEYLIKEIIQHGLIIKEKLRKGESVNLLCVCAAGISRSTATAYIILCVILGEYEERRAIAEVMSRRPIARPNALMVSIADGLLNRNFKMIAPLKNCVDFSRRDADSNESCLLF